MHYGNLVIIDPPIGRRWVFCLLSGILYFCSVDYADRVWRGYLPFICFGVFAISVLLFYLTGFSWSWGWWL